MFVLWLIVVLILTLSPRESTDESTLSVAAKTKNSFVVVQGIIFFLSLLGLLVALVMILAFWCVTPVLARRIGDEKFALRDAY